MRRLDRHVLSEGDRRLFEKMNGDAVTVLQIGEGIFLRGFFDWMIHTCRSKGLFHGSVAVIQPRPSGRDKIEALAAQDGLYTLVVRGLENGRPVERKEAVTVFSQAFDPYANWEKLIGLAVSPELRFVVSNTTEAGLVYQPEPLGVGPIRSFPGKIAYLLHCRYEAFAGAPGNGLIFLPCELLERNGDALREAVLRYAADWGYSAAFRQWVLADNRFLNTLVDRIVTGYPEHAQAEAWFTEWGFRDEMLTTAEPYHLWAIEGEPELEKLLPLRTAGLNVEWTDDLRFYQQRKVRILNGAHTWMAPLGLLHGVEQVRGVLEHPEIGPLVREAVIEEIIPTLPYQPDEMSAYADTVFERFANPYIRHRLADIAMNSISKYRARLLPSLVYYPDRGEPLPERLVLGLAGLIRYYKVKPGAEGFEGETPGGVKYTVRDEPGSLELLAGIWEEAGRSREPPQRTVERVLAEESLWGRNLSVFEGLAEAVAAHLAKW